jgi:hypothetical protein
VHNIEIGFHGKPLAGLLGDTRDCPADFLARQLYAIFARAKPPVPWKSTAFDTMMLPEI